MTWLAIAVATRRACYRPCVSEAASARAIPEGAGPPPDDEAPRPLDGDPAPSATGEPLSSSSTAFAERPRPQPRCRFVPTIAPSPPTPVSSPPSSPSAHAESMAPVDAPPVAAACTSTAIRAVDALTPFTVPPPSTAAVPPLTSRPRREALGSGRPRSLRSASPPSAALCRTAAASLAMDSRCDELPAYRIRHPISSRQCIWTPWQRAPASSALPEVRLFFPLAPRLGDPPDVDPGTTARAPSAHSEASCIDAPSPSFTRSTMARVTSRVAAHASARWATLARTTGSRCSRTKAPSTPFVEPVGGPPA